MITVPGDHLGSGVAGATAGRLERGSFLIHIAQAEVDDFQLAIVVAQQIFWFQIPMADAKLMNVMHSSYQLLKVLTRRLFFELLVFNDELEELATTCELHHEIKILVRLNNFVDLYHVGMVQLLEDLDLSTDPLNVLFVFNFRFFKHFDRNLNIEKFKIESIVATVARLKKFYSPQKADLPFLLSTHAFPV